MSIRALNWAFDQRGIHATSKLVLIAIANHADDNGYAWPGIDGIAERWGMSPRTVSRHVHLLSMDEYVAVAPRYRSNGSQTSNAYQLNMTPLTDCHPPHDNAVIPPMTTVSPPEPTIEPTLDTTPLPTVLPEWLNLLARQQPLTEHDAKVILNWAGDFPLTTLKDVAQTLVLKWPEYKRKNKSIYATFKNWYRRNGNDTYRYNQPNPTLRPVNTNIELEARIQAAGYHPASAEAAQMRAEENDEIREST